MYPSISASHTFGCDNIALFPLPHLLEQPLRVSSLMLSVCQDPRRFQQPKKTNDALGTKSGCDSSPKLYLLDEKSLGSLCPES